MHKVSLLSSLNWQVELKMKIPCIDTGLKGGSLFLKKPTPGAVNLSLFSLQAWQSSFGVLPSLWLFLEVEFDKLSFAFLTYMEGPM